MDPSTTPRSSRPGELKSKFIAQYELLLTPDADLSLESDNFWEELFLLRVNSVWINEWVQSQKGETLAELEGNLNLIFMRCVAGLIDQNTLRRTHSLQTLHAFLSAFFRFQFENFNAEILPLICKEENRSEFFMNMIQVLGQVLLTEPALREETLDVFVKLATVQDHLNRNIFIEYMILSKTPTCFFQLFSEPHSPEFFCDLFYLLSLLFSYQKHTRQDNQFLIYLESKPDSNQGDRITISEKELKGIESVLYQIIQSYNISYYQHFKPPSLFGRLSSGFGGYFVNQAVGITFPQLNQCHVSGILLFLYELVSRNPQFLKPTDPPEIPKLITEFFTLCAYISVPGQSFDSSLLPKMCLLIVSQLASNPAFQEQIHKTGVTFTDPDIWRDLNQRSILSPYPKPKTYVSNLFDLLLTMINANISKKLFSSLHIYCIDIFHKTLCYQMDHQIKASYHWKALWEVLIRFAKFLSASQKILPTNHEEVRLGNKIVLLLNTFITFGDVLLSDISDYDVLYYNLLLSRSGLDSFIEQLESIDKDGNNGSDVYNLKMILTHFVEKIDLWSKKNKGHAVSADVVLAVIKENYETLNLKLLDNLASPHVFCESTDEGPFFTEYINLLVTERNEKEKH